MPTIIPLRRTARLVVGIITAIAITSSAPSGQKSDVKENAGPPRMAELWAEPSPNRDLFFGVGGRALMPDPDELFTVIEIKATGFSDGYNVVDGKKREWSAKFPPEASTEVIASRLLWGIGFHQPPEYYLRDWRAKGAEAANPQKPARFREKKPDFHGLKDEDSWSYAENPFVGTRQLNGLLVLQAMLGNSDLKDSNNVLYTLETSVEGSSRWYVARDLGQTFGRTGVLDAPRGDIDAFEKTNLVREVVNGKVVLDYSGRHSELFRNISVADVEWICRRLSRLTDRQWHDAFRAGGYDTALATRFIRKTKAKIAEGLSLVSRERRQ